MSCSPTALLQKMGVKVLNLRSFVIWDSFLVNFSRNLDLLGKLFQNTFFKSYLNCEFLEISCRETFDF